MTTNVSHSIAMSTVTLIFQFRQDLDLINMFGLRIMDGYDTHSQKRFHRQRKRRKIKIRNGRVGPCRTLKGTTMRRGRLELLRGQPLLRRVQLLATR